MGYELNRISNKLVSFDYPVLTILLATKIATSRQRHAACVKFTLQEEDDGVICK